MAWEAVVAFPMDLLDARSLLAEEWAYLASAILAVVASDPATAEEFPGGQYHQGPLANAATVLTVSLEFSAGS